MALYLLIGHSSNIRRLFIQPKANSQLRQMSFFNRDKRTPYEKAKDQVSIALQFSSDVHLVASSRLGPSAAKSGKRNGSWIDKSLVDEHTLYFSTVEQRSNLLSYSQSPIEKFNVSPSTFVNMLRATTKWHFEHWRKRSSSNDRSRAENFFRCPFRLKHNKSQLYSAKANLDTIDQAVKTQLSRSIRAIARESDERALL